MNTTIICDDGSITEFKGLDDDGLAIFVNETGFGF